MYRKEITFEKLINKYFNRIFAMFVLMVTCFALVIIYFRLHAIDNPEKTPLVISEESENMTKVNLCVVGKKSNDFGLTFMGTPKEYMLLLSNAMTIYVTREEYEKFEVNHHYEFELVEKTTLSHEIRIKGD